MQVMCARSLHRGNTALAKLAKDGLTPELCIVDISNPLRCNFGRFCCFLEATLHFSGFSVHTLEELVESTNGGVLDVVR